MSPRKRRRRGHYVQDVADLAKDDHALFYVGEMSPLHLRGVLDLRKHSRRAPVASDGVSVQSLHARA